MNLNELYKQAYYKNKSGMIFLWRLCTNYETDG